LTSIVVKGGNLLKGTIKISGSKNAALPCLAASILTNEVVVLEKVPIIGDTKNMIEIMRLMNIKVNVNDNTLMIKSDRPDFKIPSRFSKLLRGSTLLLGSLLARRGRVELYGYGGCPIGLRPIDLHLYAFKALGAKIEQKKDSIEIIANQGLKGAEIFFNFPSVGATENAIMAACVAKGETILKNVALEPEVLDLVKMLQSMGVIIKVNSRRREIKIIGTKEISGVKHELIPDRIEAGTYAVASVIAGSKVVLEDLNVMHLRGVVRKLLEIGAEVSIKGKSNLQICQAKNPLKSLNIVTKPYPGFPTDLQPQFVTLFTQAHGTSQIFETIYENRFLHIPELCKMGAKIDVLDRKIIIEGPTTLHGSEVYARDIRGGVALVLAGLVAKGSTIINNAEVIMRGYEKIETKLRGVGAEIEVIK
jgi:UDP-N-acetylglucosamine 1-carboxyvinyltransferase